MSFLDIPIDREQLSVCTECGNLFINVYAVVKLTGDENEAVLEMYEAIEDKCCKCGSYYEILHEGAGRIS